MNIWSILLVSAAAVGLSEASTKLRFDEVEAFPQPDPVTDIDKSGVRFKPSLLVTAGCQPYPAVDASGQTSAGNENQDPSYQGCSSSTHRSQVYGRVKWHRDQWAFMYAWYFPMDKPDSGSEETPFFSHDWTSVVVWITNPEVEPKIIGVATSWPASGYKTYKPVPAGSLDGDATKIEYKTDPGNNGYHDVDVTTKDGGQFQQLIMWDQMTEAAQNALNTADFGPNATVPFNDVHFKANLDLAWLN